MTELTGVPAALPLALLPVRLETRFVTTAGGGHELLVRIFPDAIHQDAHDPRLAPVEIEARDRFAAEGGYGTDDEAAATAWRRLADTFGPARAAWIARTGDPGVPAPGQRGALWDGAAVARCLPDRWTLYAWRGDSLAIVHTGQDIPRDLPIAPDPQDAAPDLTDPDHPVFASGIAWMVDFDAAVEVGMAMRLPVEDDEGFDRIVVVGASAETGTQGASRLAALLTAHHYTDGLGLLPLGTPTNNTDAAGSGYSSADRDHATSRIRERGPHTPPPPGSDAARLAGALGVQPEVFAAVEGARLREALDAQATNAALWPATWGYFLRRLVPIGDEAALEAVRRHFVDWVRARGPLPTLRVGTQPYGVVPVVSLARLQPEPGPVEGPLHNVLTWLRGEWMRHAGQDDSIPDILRRKPVSDGYAVRGQFSTEWLPLAEGFMGLTDEQVEESVAAFTADVAQTRTMVGQIWRPEVFAPLGGVFQLPEPYPGVPPTTGTGLDPAAPAGWLAALLARLRERLPQDPEADWPSRPADSLLYLLLRHAARLVATGPAPAAVPLPPRGGVGDPDGPALPAYQEFLAAVEHLAGQPSAAVDRAARETLDLASHRLDAWVTSIATRRLAARRGAVSGVAIGGYGFVQGLRRAGDTVVDASTWPPLLARAENAGYLHAPSVPQAVTAAVLRAGHLAHGGETSDTGTTPFALDLSSARVRAADQLLAGMRQGQGLPALLGYRFERGLDEAGLAQYRPAFRRLTPGAAAGTDPVGEVVDGVRLLELHHAGAIPWGTAGLPAAGAVTGLLAGVTGALDAVGDAAVAEGVHHALQGNHHRAAAALAIGTLDQGPPPELEFVRTARTGAAVTHRLLLPLAAPPVGGWGTGPRERAEPALAAWLAALLPAPATLRADVELREPGGAVAPVRRLYLADLDPAPRPLDLLADSASPADLARRLGRHLLAPGRRPPEVGVDATARLLPEPAGELAPGEVYLADILELLTTVRTALGGARPATAADLDGQLSTSDSDGVLRDELAGRAGAAYQELLALRDALDGTDLADALVEAASFGAGGALPPAGAGPDALARQAAEVRAEVERRIAAAAAPADAGPEEQVARLRAVFGRDFTVVPRFAVAEPGTVAHAFAGTDSNGPAGQDPLAWFARMARVRPAVELAETIALYSQALGTGAGLDLAVGQFPAPAPGQTQRWVGLPAAGPDQPVAANATSVVALGAPPTAAAPIAALVLDQWSEVVPSRRETTAVAYHFDAPSSQAPQAILLAVPPREATGDWQLDELVDTVLETIDLAVARGVDPVDRNAFTHLISGALTLPNWGPSEPSGVDATRLATPPAGYGVPRTVAAPALETLTLNYPSTAASQTAVRQGREVTGIVATGQRLRGGDRQTSWRIDAVAPNPADAARFLTLVAAPDPARPDTAATLTIRAHADTPPGVYHVTVVTGSGQSSRQIRVLERFHVNPQVVPAVLRQQEATYAAAPLTITGRRFASGMTVTASHPAVRGSVTVTGPTAARLDLTVQGNPRPPVIWDPTEPGAPHKPPRPPEPVRQAVAVTLTITGVRDDGEAVPDVTKTVSITLDALGWIERDLL